LVRRNGARAAMKGFDQSIPRAAAEGRKRARLAI
jgi:hypothetical protein